MSPLRPRISFVTSETFIAAGWKLIYFKSAEYTAYSQIEPIHIILPVSLTNLIIWFSDPQQIKSTKLCKCTLIIKRDIEEYRRKTLKANFQMSSLIAENLTDLQVRLSCSHSSLPGYINIMVWPLVQDRNLSNLPKQLKYIVFGINLSV